MKAAKIRVTVNGAEVRVWAWARWRDAVTAWDARAGAALSRGGGVVRDGRGRPIDPDGGVAAGAAIRYGEEHPTEAPGGGRRRG